MLVRGAGVVVVSLSLVVGVGGCGGGCSKSDAADAIMADSALVEVLANGSVAWMIGQDGKISAQVADKDGKPITKDATGTVRWKNPAGDPSSAKLTYDERAKALVANGPPPKSDITQVDYDITASPGPLTGTLYVPVGGTAALVADAKSSANVTSDTTGPNGGAVQVVGADRVEIVADEDSDEVRAYVLGANNQPLAIGARKITLAVNADASDVVVLTPSADGLYFTGKWKASTDPSRVTIVVRSGDEAHVAIVGWKPGTKLVVAGGPKVKVKKKGLGWGPGGKPAELRGKEGASITPTGAVVKVDLTGDDGKAKGGGNGNGRGKGNGKGK